MPPAANDDSPSPGPDYDADNMVDDRADQASSAGESSSSHNNDVSSHGHTSTKSSARDPARPRRKKARRACFACQRAHLTCGDERPCMRCIKRGLQDQCHDGVRKKAKYLHDAPAEALVPGYVNHYNMNGNNHLGPGPTATPTSSASAGSVVVPVSQPGSTYFPQHSPTSGFPQFNQVTPASSINTALGDTALVNGLTPQSGLTSSQYPPTSSTQVSPIQGLSTSLNPSNVARPSADTFVEPSLFDANDASFYNFNISDLNFGNRYGALEFGMLGHMSGAVGTPEGETLNSLTQTGPGSISYDGNVNFGFNQSFPAWQSIPHAGPGSRQGSTSTAWNNHFGGTDAFAIGEQMLTGLSPSAQPGFNLSPTMTADPSTTFNPLDQNNQPNLLGQGVVSHPHSQQPNPSFPHEKPSEVDQRRRQTSEIYTTVKEPYSYTQGFHAMTAFLQRRYPSKKVLRIAKAMASIRPSFISCNQHLNYADLIFMEKSFQRTLCEYEDFISSYGTLTLICRRTGEIAGVSKEFSLVTGWHRDVLLGKETNLNINTGSSGNTSGTQTGTSSRGAVTPRSGAIGPNPGRPQPVFLAELLDEDSVVKFYEDFAELAFGASRTSIIGVQCSLIKYRTKDDPAWRKGLTSVDSTNPDEGARPPKLASGRALGPPSSNVKGETNGETFGDKDGMVDCMMCWTVKRDTFDIPMLIVMNFETNTVCDGFMRDVALSVCWLVSVLMSQMTAIRSPDRQQLQPYLLPRPGCIDFAKLAQLAQQLATATA